LKIKKYIFIKKNKKTSAMKLNIQFVFYDEMNCRESMNDNRV